MQSATLADKINDLEKLSPDVKFFKEEMPETTMIVL